MKIIYGYLGENDTTESQACYPYTPEKWESLKNVTDRYFVSPDDDWHMTVKNKYELRDVAAPEWLEPEAFVRNAFRLERIMLYGFPEQDFPGARRLLNWLLCKELSVAEAVIDAVWGNHPRSRFMQSVRAQVLEWAADENHRYLSPLSNYQLGALMSHRRR